MADSDDDAAPDEPVIGGGAKPGISLNIGGGKSSSFREESAEIAGGEVTLLIKNEEGKEVSSSVRSTLPAPDPHAAPAAPTPYLLLTTQFAVGFTVEAVKALCKKLFDLGEEKPITVCAPVCSRAMEPPAAHMVSVRRLSVFPGSRAASGRHAHDGPNVAERLRRDQAGRDGCDRHEAQMRSRHTRARGPIRGTGRLRSSLSRSGRSVTAGRPKV